MPNPVACSMDAPSSFGIGSKKHTLTGERTLSAECRSVVFAGGFLYNKGTQRENGAIELHCNERNRRACDGVAELATDGSVTMTHGHGPHLGSEAYNARQFSRVLHVETERRDYAILAEAMKEAMFGERK